MRDRRSTDERAKRSGINIEKNWARTEPCGIPQERGNEGELCGGILTVDVEMTLERWSCRESSVISAEYNLV